MDSDRSPLTRIGRNIVVERAKKDWTQTTLAERAGVSLSHIARMERGDVDARILMYFRVARALEVAVPDLLHGTEDH